MIPSSPFLTVYLLSYHYIISHALYLFACLLASLPLQCKIRRPGYLLCSQLQFHHYGMVRGIVVLQKYFSKAGRKGRRGKGGRVGERKNGERIFCPQYKKNRKQYSKLIKLVWLVLKKHYKLVRQESTISMLQELLCIRSSLENENVPSAIKRQFTGSRNLSIHYHTGRFPSFPEHWGDAIKVKVTGNI